MADYNEYDLAKPNPFTGDGEATERIDLSGFRPGVDRMKTAPEFLADSRKPGGRLPFDGPPEPEWKLGPGQIVLPVTGETSDGYHTFNELYDHRRALTAALLSVAPWFAWRSKAHHPDDTPIYDGTFIVGLDLPQGTITYHYNLEHWDDFSEVTEIPYPLKWDGATPAETVTRLLAAARGK